MTETANNTSITSSYITDVAGKYWTIVPTSAGGRVFYNGAIDNSTLNVASLLYFNHTVYHKNTSGNWYVFINPGWQQTTDPRLAESSGGTTVTTVGPAIIDSVQEKWTLVNSASQGMQIAVNGTVDSVTHNVVLLLYKNHMIYQQNNLGGWWSKSKASDATWAATSDPRVSPTPSPTPTPSPSPSGQRPYLIGVWDTVNDNPSFSSYMGYHPDFVITWTYYSPEFAAGGVLSMNNGYPSVAATAHYGGSFGSYQSPFTAKGAAIPAGQSGSYFGPNGAITQGMQKSLSPWANQVYAMRISREWNLSSNDWSPYYNNGGHGATVDPATWKAGWNNYAQQLKTLYPNMKLAWDYPCRTDPAFDTNPEQYYPGDTYVDIISCDIYFVAAWNGTTSQNGWDALNSWTATGLTQWSNFAKAHNKPMAVWEWGDNYGDGYCTKLFDQWMKQQNLVAHCYWNSGAAISGNSCALLASTNTGTKTQYQADWNSNVIGSKYTGSFWTYKPLPTSIPSGF